jgi:hypothetical protein
LETKSTLTPKEMTSEEKINMILAEKLILKDVTFCQVDVEVAGTDDFIKTWNK